MYIKESKWYQNQEKKRAQMKWFVHCVGMMFCIGFGVFLGSTLSLAQDYKRGDLSQYVEVDKHVDDNDHPIFMEAYMPGMNQMEWVWMHLPGVEGEKETSGLLSVKDYVPEAEQAPEDSGSDLNQTMAQQAVASDETQLQRRPCIAIDAGHGGEDEGCSFDGVEEKSINLRLAAFLKEKLVDGGYDVIMIREEDKQVSLRERVERANLAGADAFISIHQNACEDEAVQGIEVWYGTNKAESERLASLVERYTVAETDAKGRGTIPSDTLLVIRETNMASVLVETGYLSNDKEKSLLQDDVYLDKLAEGMFEALQYYFYPKEMYLTFDDGPSRKNTEAILDILKEKDIKATFFVIGENVEKYPEVAKRIVAEGHTIGIHCYRHDYDDIYADVDAYFADFQQAKQVVFEVTGVEAKLFRFPGGSINSYNEEVYADIIKEMNGQGYIYFDWNASLEDAVRNPEEKQLIQNAKDSTLGRKKIIMLAHDTVDETAACLDALIDAFPEYEMKALDENVIPIQF